jgi:predicted transposase/invertase (TIGR01784 family)
VDVVFKALFAATHNRDLLMSLLNGVLTLVGQPEVVEVSVLTPFSTVDLADDKISTVDLAVRDQRGKQYLIEMQCRNRGSFPERLLYYGARRYGEQLRFEAVKI